MNIYLSITLSLILAILAFIKKALTKPALILAFCFAIIICYCGNLKTYLILVIVFLGAIITKKIKQHNLYSDQNLIEKSGAKDIYQIIANVSIGAILLLIYYLTNNEIFLISYSCVMAESLADTLASDIGVLSKKAPINIITFKKSTPGLSGNVSTLGFASALLGSTIISIIFSFSNFKLSIFLIIILSSFLGCLVDSLLGAALQVQYRCQKCQIITEKKYHCKTPTKYYKGLKIINNDVVNFISNTITMLISILLLTIF